MSLLAREHKELYTTGTILDLLFHFLPGYFLPTMSRTVRAIFCSHVGTVMYLLSHVEPVYRTMEAGRLSSYTVCRFASSRQSFVYDISLQTNRIMVSRLQTRVLICLCFAAMLVTGTVLYLISHFNPYEWRRMCKDREATLREAESFTCLNSFWFIVSTLFLQGNHHVFLLEITFCFVYLWAESSHTLNKKMIQYLPPLDLWTYSLRAVWKVC